MDLGIVPDKADLAEFRTPFRPTPRKSIPSSIGREQRTGLFPRHPQSFNMRLTPRHHSSGAIRLTPWPPTRSPISSCCSTLISHDRTLCQHTSKSRLQGFQSHPSRLSRTTWVQSSSTLSLRLEIEAESLDPAFLANFERRFVLTVPAVWSDKAKSMTLEARYILPGLS